MIVRFASNQFLLCLDGGFFFLFFKWMGKNDVFKKNIRISQELSLDIGGLAYTINSLSTEAYMLYL